MCEIFKENVLEEHLKMAASKLHTLSVKGLLVKRDKVLTNEKILLIKTNFQTLSKIPELHTF